MLASRVKPKPIAKPAASVEGPILKPDLQLFGKGIGATPYKGVRKPEIDFAGKTGIGRETLAGHLKNHGKDFGFTTETEYLQGARRFFEKPLTPTTEAFTSNQGWYFRYGKATNEFGLINNYGGISTYYKPDEGYAYWLREIEKYIAKK